VYVENDAAVLSRKHRRCWEVAARATRLQKAGVFCNKEKLVQGHLVDRQLVDRHLVDRHLVDFWKMLLSSTDSSSTDTS
jgi:hypothetical protein